jgi:hypothetical protein
MPSRLRKLVFSASMFRSTLSLSSFACLRSFTPTSPKQNAHLSLTVFIVSACTSVSARLPSLGFSRFVRVCDTCVASIGLTDAEMRPSIYGGNEDGALNGTSSDDDDGDDDDDDDDDYEYAVDHVDAEHDGDYDGDNLVNEYHDGGAFSSSVSSDDDSYSDDDDDGFVHGLKVGDATRYDASFDGCGEEEETVVWVVDGMTLRCIDTADHGTFRTGDCNVVLRTGRKPSGGGLEWNIHFWEGADAAAAKMAVAAIKVTELARFLGGTGSQHRELQGEESGRFLSYFAATGDGGSGGSGVQYLNGGTRNGLRHHVANDAHLLYRVKGNRRVAVSRVTCKSSSLNSGDVFVLDAQQHIYVWVGKDANFRERATGIQFSLKIKSLEKRPVDAEIHHLFENRLPADREERDEHQRFWRDMGGSGRDASATVQGAKKGGDDESTVVTVDLYRITEGQRENIAADTNTTYDDDVAVTYMHPTARGRHIYSMLDSRAVFFMNCDNEVYVWVGRLATEMQKAKATAESLVMESIERFERPEWTPIYMYVCAVISACMSFLST